MTDPSLRKILLVEDDPDIRAVAALALKAVGGFSVLACGSGREALDAGPSFGPDLVLLDVMMPGLDGPGTLAELRNDPVMASAPVVFLTAKVQGHEVARYREMGAVDVIAKPFDPMRLAAAVQAIWARRGTTT